MNNSETAHHDNGLKGILSTPYFYNIFGSLISKKRARLKFVQDAINPFPGCRILDIGCGPASIASYLPHFIGEYCGFDMNPSYIKFAKEKWGDNEKFKFNCAKVSDETITEYGNFDIVIAVGILHHLNDKEAGDLLNIAYKALKDNSTLITYDNVYVENQHWFAKWFISKDRGQAVRTIHGYRQLVAPFFKKVEAEILHDTLKVPYTIFQMKCTKEGSSS